MTALTIEALLLTIKYKIELCFQCSLQNERLTSFTSITFNHFILKRLEYYIVHILESWRFIICFFFFLFCCCKIEDLRHSLCFCCLVYLTCLFCWFILNWKAEKVRIFILWLIFSKSSQISGPRLTPAAPAASQSLEPSSFALSVPLDEPGRNTLQPSDPPRAPSAGPYVTTLNGPSSGGGGHSVGPPGAQGYSTVHPHWFFCRMAEGKSVWFPFSLVDSMNLEEACMSGDTDMDTLVATDGGR